MDTEMKGRLFHKPEVLKPHVGKGQVAFAQVNACDPLLQGRRCSSLAPFALQMFPFLSGFQRPFPEILQQRSHPPVWNPDVNRTV